MKAEIITQTERVSEKDYYRGKNKENILILDKERPLEAFNCSNYIHNTNI